MRRILIAITLITAFAASTAFAADDVIAKMGEKKITNADFDKFVNLYPPDKKKFLDEKLQNRKIIFERMVQVEVVSDIARKQGLDQDPAIKAQLDYFLKEILAEEMLKRVGEAEPPENDVLDYYKSRPDEFKTPEMVRVRHILIKVDKAPTDAEMIVARGMAKEKADSVLKRVKAGEDFAKLAEEYSEDPGSKKKGGDLGFIGRGRTAPEFEAKAFSMKPGETSDLVETKFGYHILRVEERKEAGVQPFEVVKDAAKAKLKAFIKKTKTEAFMHQAYKDAGVELFLDNMKLPEKK